MEIEFPHAKDLSDPNPSMPPAKIRKVQEFKHELEANRARYSELNPDLIAVRVDCAPITIFRRGSEFPETVLSAQGLDSGFALEWSQNGLITGDYKGNIVHWNNIEQQPQQYHHPSPVEDTKFIDECIFGTASDDGLLGIWDIRSGKNEIKVQASEN